MFLQLYTRMYLAGDAGQCADPVLALVPTERRVTLIGGANRAPVTPSYRCDIPCRRHRRCFRYLDLCLQQELSTN